MTQAVGLMTAEELEHVSIPGKTTELLRGRLVVHEPPSSYHGAVAGRVAYVLGAFVYPHNAGVVFGEAGFKIESSPDTVRAPDVGFLSRDRGIALPLRGYGAFAPDLAVEIVSPDDRPGEIVGKAADWLRAGVRLVWIIDPGRREAHVYRADGSVAVIATDGHLDGEDVLAGFECALSDVFTDLPPKSS